MFENKRGILIWRMPLRVRLTTAASGLSEASGLSAASSCHPEPASRAAEDAAVAVLGASQPVVPCAAADSEWESAVLAAVVLDAEAPQDARSAEAGPAAPDD